MTLALAALAWAPSAAHGAEFDLMILNGTVIDGTGKPRFRANVGVIGDRIAYVGKGKRRAKQVVDASGLIVAPGFIDAHNHAPDQAREAPTPFLNEPFLKQGVTTVVAGPDGYYSPKELRAIFATLTAKGFGTNYACYVGHNGIRSEVMGRERRKPTPDELERMKALVREGMRMGCAGLSTGLMYEPGMFSDTDEVIELAKEVRPFDGTYDSHTRNPVAEMIASEKEAIDIGKAAGIPTKLGHLKAVGLTNKGRIGEVIAMVEAARRDGVDAVADQYPYDGAGTIGLKSLILFPDGRSEGEPSLEDVKARLRKTMADPAAKAALKSATEKGINGGFAWVKAVGYGSMRIVHAPGRAELVNQNIQLLARQRGIEPFDLIVGLLLQDGAEPLLTLGSIEEADVRELLVRPWVMIASDGDYTSDSSHPRSTGTFTRVLGHYSRDQKLLPLEEAVRKMTSLPADHLRLHDRGRILKGKIADITLFDAAKVGDRSTYAQPTLLSEGVAHVFVNGKAVLRNGVPTGLAPGRFVPRQSRPAGR